MITIRVESEVAVGGPLYCVDEEKGVLKATLIGIDTATSEVGTEVDYDIEFEDGVVASTVTGLDPDLLFCGKTEAEMCWESMREEEGK
jgi:hypothetical protein